MYTGKKEANVAKNVTIDEIIKNILQAMLDCAGHINLDEPRIREAIYNLSMAIKDLDDISEKPEIATEGA